MSGVQISGEIVPFATAVPPYPVFQDVNGKGGYFAGVLDIPARNAILASFRKEGMLCYVAKTKCIYALQPDLVTWNIIANVNLGAQATWFIDPGNSSGTASDNNDGLTAGTALLTAREFMNRCFPGGQALVATVAAITITIVATAAQTVPILSLNIANGFAPSTIVDVTVNCQFSSGAAITLATVTQMNATTNTRGRLTTAAGAFVNKQRIRVTSGANAGAICYSMGLTSALDTFISCPAKDISASVTYPAPGDTVVLDTLLVTINRCDIQCGPLCRVKVNDAKVTRAILRGPDLATFAGAGGGITLQGCEAISAGGTWMAPFGAQYINCNVIATSKTSFWGNNVLYSNHVIHGVMSMGMGSHYTAGIWINAGNLICGSSDNFTHIGMTAMTKVYMTSNFSNTGALEAENGPGPNGATFPAIFIGPGTIVQNDSFATELWGVSGGYAIGIQLTALAWMYFANDPGADAVLQTFLKITSTNNLNIGGQNFAYSKNPIIFKTLSCGIVVQPITALTTENYVSLTAQVANIAATNMLVATGARKGTYRFRGYIAPTNVGAAGNLVLNAIYTDESGTLQTTPVCTINNAVLAGVGGSIEVESNGATAIQYSVTGFTAGLIYNLRVAVEYDSNGP